MSTLGTIVVKMVGDTGGFTSSMQAAEKTAGSASDSIVEKLSSIGKVAAGIAVAGIAALGAGLMASVEEASRSQQGLAQLDAALKSTAASHEAAGSKTVWVADSVNKLAGQTVTLTEKTNALAGATKKQLAEIAAAPAKLETATARLHDMEAAYAKAKTHTESATLALSRQRETVAELTATIAKGNSAITESSRVVGAVSGHWDKVTGSTQVARQTILDLADSIQMTTKFADDDVIAASSMMLTFTNVGKDVFPAVIKTTMDMSQALGQDATQSAMQLGKALNDPVAGVTALQRVGVKLTDAQKAQVKGFMAVNDIAGAQNVILQELQTEFGGSAEAAGNTFAGKMAIAGHVIDDVKETIGMALLPVLTKLATAFSTALNDPGVQAGISNIAAGITTIVDKLSLGAEAIVTFATTMQTGLAAGSDPFATLNVGLFNFLTTLGATPAAAAQAAASIAGFASTASAIIGTIGTAFSTGDFGPLLTMVQGWAGIFLNWVQNDVIPFIGQKITELGIVIGTWVTNNAPIIEAKVKDWAGTFLNWVDTSVVPFIGGKLSGIWFEISNWIGLQGVLLGIKLQEWAIRFTDWIQMDVVPSLPSKLYAIGDAVGKWIVTASKDYDKNLTKWSASFGDWIIRDAVPAIIKALPAITSAINTWMYGLPMALLSAMAIAASGIVNGLITAIGGELPKLRQFLYDVIKAAIVDIAGVLGIKVNMPNLPPWQLPGRALGGSVSAGSAYMVGEDGPEPFIPSTNGTILPNGSMGGEVHNHLSIDGTEIVDIVVNRLTGALIAARPYTYGAQ